MSRLISWTLNVAYLTLMLLASPWIVWAAVLHGKYREGFAQKLLGRAPHRTGDQPCVWLHAVSVGEVKLLATVLDSLKRSRPEWDFVISTTTKTGYDLARRTYAEYTVFYCPLDFSWATRNAMQRARPDLLILAELELWPNLIRAAADYGARIAIINGRLSDNSFRGYRRVRPIVSRLLHKVDLVAAQNAETAERFSQLGAPRVNVTGSLKFDGARTDRNNPKTEQLRQLANIQPEDIVFLAGSTQAPEEQCAIDVFRKLADQHPSLRLILVPRHPERFDDVAALLERSGIDWIRRSAFDQETSEIHNPHSAILIDTVGELGAWWGTASIGFVGGSFGNRGGQNMLEPAAYGVATCFGRNTRNFRDIVGQLLRADAAQVVHDQEELEQFVRRVIEDRDWYSAMAQRAQALVLSQQGATDRTTELLLSLLADEKASTDTPQAA